MKSAIHKFYALVFIPLLVVSFFSCKGKDAATTKAPSLSPAIENNSAPAVKLVSMDSPGNKQVFHSGDDVKLVLSVVGNKIADSIRVYFDGAYLATIVNKPFEYSINTRESRLGEIPVKVIAYSGEKRPQTLTRFVLLLSDIVPGQLSYRVIKKYPHDRNAYTQGLLVHKGYFYESTGQEGRSTLRKVDMQTGEVIMQHRLENKFFGEGLVYFKGRFYQLTWVHNTGFVYDADTFTEIRKIHYETQGWGITTDGERLIMSDGTNKIYFLEPEYFTVTGSLDVYDNEKAVYQLNELEYIDGVLWANIYQTDLVARIDINTGKVLDYINLAGLLHEDERIPGETDVLNGIAYEKETGKLFVTGKMWPYLYEIELR